MLTWTTVHGAACDADDISSALRTSWPRRPTATVQAVTRRRQSCAWFVCFSHRGTSCQRLRTSAILESSTGYIVCFRAQHRRYRFQSRTAPLDPQSVSGCLSSACTSHKACEASATRSSLRRSARSTSPATSISGTNTAITAAAITVWGTTSPRGKCCWGSNRRAWVPSGLARTQSSAERRRSLATTASASDRAAAATVRTKPSGAEATQRDASRSQTGHARLRQRERIDGGCESVASQAREGKISRGCRASRGGAAANVAGDQRQETAA
mmetsp:Transcript_8078/g.18057  ORF Transcript_8078/g.18057 Transcript_8078/m.18057 type:complete len:270 (-) Transcript_8078:172-981(-)